MQEVLSTALGKILSFLSLPGIHCSDLKSLRRRRLYCHGVRWDRKFAVKLEFEAVSRGHITKPTLEAEFQRIALFPTHEPQADMEVSIRYRFKKTLTITYAYSSYRNKVRTEVNS